MYIIAIVNNCPSIRLVSADNGMFARRDCVIHFKWFIQPLYPNIFIIINIVSTSAHLWSTINSNILT